MVYEKFALLTYICLMVSILMEQFYNVLYTVLNRKTSFTNRVAMVWNNLPDEVTTARILHSFKYTLDKISLEQGNKGRQKIVYVLFCLFFYVKLL